MRDECVVSCRVVSCRFVFESFRLVFHAPPVLAPAAAAERGRTPLREPDFCRTLRERFMDRPVRPRRLSALDCARGAAEAGRPFPESNVRSDRSVKSRRSWLGESNGCDNGAPLAEEDIDGGGWRLMPLDTIRHRGLASPGEPENSMISAFQLF